MSERQLSDRTESLRQALGRMSEARGRIDRDVSRRTRELDRPHEMLHELEQEAGSLTRSRRGLFRFSERARDAARRMR